MICPECIQTQYIEFPLILAPKDIVQMHRDEEAEFDEKKLYYCENCGHLEEI